MRDATNTSIPNGEKPSDRHQYAGHELAAVFRGDHSLRCSLSWCRALADAGTAPPAPPADALATPPSLAATQALCSIPLSASRRSENLSKRTLSRAGPVEPNHQGRLIDRRADTRQNPVSSITPQAGDIMSAWRTYNIPEQPGDIVEVRSAVSRKDILW
jgi:hypothetical protein